MSAPGNYSNLQNAYIVDAALDILDHGGTLSNAQLAQATAAAKELTSSWGDPDRSRWSRNVLQQWTDARNGYFDRQFSQTANSSGNAVDLSGIDTSKLIMFPTGSELEALKNTAAGSNAVLFPAGNNIATAQNGQLALDSQISSSADHWTKAQDHDILNKTEKDAPYYEKAGGCI